MVGALIALVLGVGLVPLPVSAGSSQYFPATGQTSGNAFYEFLQTHGGLEILGMPLSPASAYQARTGFVTQVYERAVMEWHPGNTREYRVQVGRYGSLFLDNLIGATSGIHREQALASTPARACATGADCRTFAATQHNVRGAFLDYWSAHGGLATFGYPLTEEADFCLGDSEASCDRTVTGQVFERAAFEWHPEIDGGTIHLRLLGTDYWGTMQDQSSIQGVNVPDYNGGTIADTQPAIPRYAPPEPQTFAGSVSGSVCPAHNPVKGDDKTGVYYVPGQQYYTATNARTCFATEADAVNAGYRSSRA